MRQGREFLRLYHHGALLAVPVVAVGAIDSGKVGSVLAKRRRVASKQGNDDQSASHGIRYRGVGEETHEGRVDAGPAAADKSQDGFTVKGRDRVRGKGTKKGLVVAAVRVIARVELPWAEAGVARDGKGMGGQIGCTRQGQGWTVGSHGMVENKLTLSTGATRLVADDLGPVSNESERAARANKAGRPRHGRLSTWSCWRLHLLGFGFCADE